MVSAAGAALLVLAGCTDASPVATPETTEAEPSTTASTTPPEPTLPATAAPQAGAVTSTAPGSTAGEPATTDAPLPASPAVSTGAQQLADNNFAQLEGRRVGLIANHTSVVGDTHLIDLLSEAPEVTLVKAFAPEHGIRGTADAGIAVPDEVDPATGTPIVSLYGAALAPSSDQLGDLDVVVFDLQDVGARFYTYLSTMGLAMQAAAAAGVDFLVLDRPNPLGGITSGFGRDDDQVSFISQYPEPALHGMTPGEVAQSIVANRWLPGVESLRLDVVPLVGWDHTMLWPDTGLVWPVPSPGLPTFTAALVYPGTVLFEATTLSYGSGTEAPFTRIGAPWLDGEALAEALDDRALPGVAFSPLRFTPEAIENVAPEPRLEGVEVVGVDIEVVDPTIVEPVALGAHLLELVFAQATELGEAVIDREATFDLLAGTSRYRELLEGGASADEIVLAWADDVADFARVRERSLLYPDGDG
jgi:uncharacterized protein YbbC (DUF1343 family)